MQSGRGAGGGGAWPRPELSRLDSCTAGGEEGGGSSPGQGDHFLARERSGGSGPVAKLGGGGGAPGVLGDEPAPFSRRVRTASWGSVALK